MASSGVIGRHRAAAFTGSRPCVVARRPSRSSRAWLGPLLALLAIAVLPMVGRAVALFTPTASAPASTTTAHTPQPVRATPSAAAPRTATADATAVQTSGAVPSASSAPATPRHRPATRTTPAARAVVPAPVVAAPPAASGPTAAQAPVAAPQTDPGSTGSDAGTTPAGPPAVDLPPDTSGSTPADPVTP